VSRGRGKPDLAARARRVKLLIVDVDGVLTDGRMILDDRGSQIKFFDVHDGLGLVLARQAGLKTAIITAERSRVVSIRARQMKIDWVAQFARDKAKAFRACRAHFGLSSAAIGYIGDDLLDLPVLTQVGFSAAVADARPEIKKRVHYVTKASGGRGAVREVVEKILQAQGRWQPIVRRYLAA